MKTSPITSAWLLAMLWCSQFAPTSACSFVKVHGTFNASSKHIVFVTEEKCFQQCYNTAACTHIGYDQGTCTIYMEGNKQLYRNGLAYELRRDELLSGCQRKVTMTPSGTTLEATSPKQDEQQISTTAADEETKTALYLTGWHYFNETKMYYKV
ncbi:hypothetical protein Aduo_009828 [Ancylostoma duodenale]